MDINRILQQLDELVESGDLQGAEQFMTEIIDEAKRQQAYGLQLQMLNELMGFYRETSRWEGAKEVIAQALALSEQMGLSGTMPYATTLLNCANAYRAMGETEKSLEYYRKTEEIYREQLQPDDMPVASFYNNFSLLYQELGQYEQAKKYLLAALPIVEKNGAVIETAVTYANLANTCVCLSQEEEGERYAKKAIRLFREQNYIDAHYCAAVSALGMCAYHRGAYKEAEQYFSEAMEIVEKTLGKTEQYKRLKENREAARKAGEEKSLQTGMELCREFYETYGRPMIEKQFPEYQDRIAAGLCGEGSECFGFDDGYSKDHDWGSGFCLWVTDETYAEIGEALVAAYEGLRKEFRGIRAYTTDAGQGRRGVFKISEFFRKFTGAASYENIDWTTAEDALLATAVNGAVFTDPEGIFTAWREKLKQGYPERIRLLKLAEAAALFSQSGQYNYPRMLARGDKLTAQIMKSDGIRQAMRLYHILQNIYPPHDKWLYRSLGTLQGGSILQGLLENISEAKDGEDTVAAFEQAGEFLAHKLYEANDISDIDPYLDFHTGELRKKAQMAEYTEEELVDAVVRTEFQAFDKVKNEGGRAYCQDDWPTFSVMRKSQYLLWSRPMLTQYLYDFTREYEKGHNLITEKYGRMMESTAPEEYEKIKDNFPEISPEKKAIIEEIVSIQMTMAEEFAAEYPNLAANARNLHTYEDNLADTSYETYLRGELSTYSDKMLQLYGAFVVECIDKKQNITKMTIEKTAVLYGYQSLEEFAAQA